MCPALIPPGVIECKPGCMLGPANGVCRQVSAHPSEAELREDSVVFPGAVLAYPKTKMVFLFGATDCGEPVPAGLAYATKVTTEKRIEFVPRTPHALMSTEEGRAAILRAIDEGTRQPRP